MKKTILAAALSMLTFTANAECVKPSKTINYAPSGVLLEYCFETPVDKYAGDSLSVKFTVDQSNPNSIFLTSLKSGVFSNAIVFLKNGKREEFNILTLEQSKVESVQLIKIEE